MRAYTSWRRPSSWKAVRPDGQAQKPDSYPSIGNTTEMAPEGLELCGPTISRRNTVGRGLSNRRRRGTFDQRSVGAGFGNDLGIGRRGLVEGVASKAR